MFYSIVQIYKYCTLKCYNLWRPFMRFCLIIFSQMLWWTGHRRVRLCGKKNTAESDSVVRRTPQSQTLWWEGHRRVSPKCLNNQVHIISQSLKCCVLQSKESQFSKFKVKCFSKIETLFENIKTYLTGYLVGMEKNKKLFLSIPQSQISTI